MLLNLLLIITLLMLFISFCEVWSSSGKLDEVKFWSVNVHLPWLQRVCRGLQAVGVVLGVAAMCLWYHQRHLDGIIGISTVADLFALPTVMFTCSCAIRSLAVILAIGSYKLWHYIWDIKNT